MPRAPRYLAFDDGAFLRSDDTVPIAGVMTRGAHTVEAVVVDRVAVDGWDAAERVADCVQRLPGAGPDVLLLDGVALGGLNLIDLGGLARTLGRSVLAVTRRAPDAVAMRRAAERTTDPERRVALLPGDPPHPVSFAQGILFVQGRDATGGLKDAATIRDILLPTMDHAALPEPLRLAHMVATALSRGVSGTPA